MVSELSIPYVATDAFAWCVIVPTDIGMRWCNYELNDIQLLVHSLDEHWAGLLGIVGGCSTWVLQVVGGVRGAYDMLEQCGYYYTCGVTGVFFRVGSPFAARIARIYKAKILRQDGHRWRAWLDDPEYKALALKVYKRRCR